MFYGHYEHAIDDKGRLAIPAGFRKKLGTASTPLSTDECVLYVTISDACLAVYPQAAWQEKLAQISKLNQLDPAVASFRRIFIGCAQECTVDKSGRILLTPELRKEAHIDKECVLVGQLEKFEIWSASRWRSTFATLTDTMSSLVATLSQQGISI